MSDQSSCRNLMLTLAYDGSGYCGWQIQPNGLTVQECVETAVEKLTGSRTHVLCAGRTDTGVHALGQVASFRTASRIPAAQMRRGLQRFLPDDIVVVSTRDVRPEFHATHSALRKRYRYVIFDGTVCPPFLRRLVHRSREPLDVRAMERAAGFLLGTHDFRCFETHYPNKQTSVRTIQEVSLKREQVWHPWQSGHQWMTISSHISEQRDASIRESPLIVFEVMADGFLYNMVRAIVGTLIRIGVGQRPPEDMGVVIGSMDRGVAGMTAPASGLYLVNVDYPEALLNAAEPNSADPTSGTTSECGGGL